MDSLSSEEDNTVVSMHSIQRKVILEFIDRIQKEVSIYTINEKYSNRQDIDSRLQCERIGKIFDTCIHYIKLASNLPTFLIESPDLITASIPTLEIASLNVTNISSKPEEFNLVLGQYLTVFDHHRNRTKISHINDLQVKIQSRFHESTCDQLNEINVKQLSVGVRNIIALLSALKRIAEHKIQTNASLELAKQKVLHQIWSNNDVNVRTINSIIREMEENQAIILRNTTVKRDEIQQYKLEKEQLKQKSNNEFTRLM